MTKEIQFRRGSTSDHISGAGFTGALAEVTVDTTNNTLRVHDGSTLGGHELVGVAVTQRITNKDIVAIGLSVTGISTISVDSSSDALRITQTGSGNALVVEDETNPDATPFVIRATGFVGIGTTNPTKTLHVEGTARISDQIVFGSGNKGAGANIKIGASSGSGLTSAAISNIMIGDFVGGFATSGGFNVLIGTVAGSNVTTGDHNVCIGSYSEVPIPTGDDQLVISNSSVSWINGNSSGNIGIGTTNPTEKLHVDGNIQTSGNILNALGDRFLVGVSTVTVLTSGTTYTPPANLISALVIATGGGGGGGGADGADVTSGSGGGGGGAGATAIRCYSAQELGASATYSIGGAGNAGSGTNGTSGTAGGNTTFTPAGPGGTLTANGGALGSGGGAQATGVAVRGGIGGLATGGQFNTGGGDGGDGGGADATEMGIGGVGGGSFWGGGGSCGMAANAGATAGTTASTYGSGGGGAGAQDTTTGAAGGAGYQGVIFVLEFTG